MNYWKQFAEMLGVELGEEFVLTDSDGERRDEYTYKFVKYGLLCIRPTFIGPCSKPPATLGSILNGDYKAVPKLWKPAYRELYWYYSPMNGLVNYARWDDGCDELLLWKVGNCFKTKEEAETKGKEIMEQIMKEFAKE